MEQLDSGPAQNPTQLIVFACNPRERRVFITRSAYR